MRSATWRGRDTGLATLIVVVLIAVTIPVSRVAAAERLLVGVEALGAMLAAPDVRIIDMADEPADYQRGHIPGAVYVDLEHTRVVVPDRGVRLLNEEEASRLFGGLGLTPDTRVVVYDNAGGLNAAWLFFVLDVYGHHRVALLDGGIAAWKRAGRPLVREAPRIEPRPTA